MRDWQDHPLGRVYDAAVGGDPIALAAIELMPDLTEAVRGPVTKSRKKKAAARGAVMRNVRWAEQVAALRHSQQAGILSAAQDVLKAARDMAASGYDEAQFLRDLSVQGSPLAREIGR